MQTSHRKQKTLVSHSRLTKLLGYDPESGTFVWKTKRRGQRAPGTEAGYVDKARGYRVIRVDTVAYQAHHLAWFYVNKKDSDLEIDHKDGNGLNNAIENLREATCQQNTFNTRSKTKQTHGFKGILYCAATKRWRARIHVSGKNIYLGRHDTPEIAARAYDEAAKTHFGVFARLNFPETVRA